MAAQPSTQFWIDNAGEGFEAFERTPAPSLEFAVNESESGGNPDANAFATFSVGGAPSMCR